MNLIIGLSVLLTAPPSLPSIPFDVDKAKTLQAEWNNVHRSLRDSHKLNAPADFSLSSSIKFMMRSFSNSPSIACGGFWEYSMS